MTRNLKNNRYACALVILLGIAAVVAGCNKKEAPPVPAQQAAAVAKPPVSVPKPVQNKVSSSVKFPSPPVNPFDFSTKKDPFKPYVVIKTLQAVSQESERSKMSAALPIHSFDVSQFRLIGIVTGGKDNHAMVTDPNGKGYVLKVGMTIGKNSGRVTAITNGGVDVLEQFRDDNGRVRKENIRIALPRKP